MHYKKLSPLFKGCNQFFCVCLHFIDNNTQNVCHDSNYEAVRETSRGLSIVVNYILKSVDKHDTDLDFF